MPRAGPALVVALALAGTLASAQRNQQLWYQAYEAGVRDIDRGAYDSAVQNLTAAKQGGPAPARRVVFYGDRVDSFNPDYFLGVAYLNLRRFADADAAFERVRRANLIPANDKQYGTFQTQASQAKAEVTFAQAEDLLAKRQYKGAMDAAERASSLGIARTRVQDLQQRVASLERLADAAGQLATGPPAPAAPPDQTVAQTTPEPGGIPGTAGGQQQQQQQQQPPPAATQTLPQFGTLAKLDPGLIPAPPAVPPKPLPRFTVPKAGLNTESLARAGIVAYYAGRYEEAAAILSETPGGPAQARARFYLACSLAAQVLAGVGDESGLTAAKARLREAGPLDQFSNDRRFISPRVLAALSIPR